MSWLHFVLQFLNCRWCEGTGVCACWWGWVSKHPCRECGGTGRGN